jgi:hypothetical protein
VEEISVAEDDQVTVVNRLMTLRAVGAPCILGGSHALGGHALGGYALGGYALGGYALGTVAHGRLRPTVRASLRG